MASQEEFFASLAPSSIETTPMPDVAVATIEGPLREHFVEVLSRVGGNVGDGTGLDSVRDKAGQRTSALMTLVEHEHIGDAGN